MVTPPASEAELLERAHNLAGLQLAELAEVYSCKVPKDLRRDKGWQGQLLEKALGTTAATKAEPDFQHLGIELKTLPIDGFGKPQESTFVSTIPLLQVGSLTWRTSYVYRKLARVLWFPIKVTDCNYIGERTLGMPLLWSPSTEQEYILAQDWEELTDMLSMGQIDEVSAHQGQYLQVRPKAASGSSLRHGVGSDGSTVLTLPRGFYLRASFTEMILRDNYLIQS